MNHTMKLLSLFLALLMMGSAMTGLSVITASAEETTTETGTGTDEAETIDYRNEVYATPEEKLATMKLMTTKGHFQIYAESHTGEVAVRDTQSGQILFTNPYDVGTATASDSVKNKLLSQVIVKFSDNGREKEYSSFEYAAERDQIKVKNIKNGIRVEYTIGREEARHLVPHMMEKTRFETLIQAPMENYYGISYEEAKKVKDQGGHPLQAPAFYFCKYMSYFQFRSLAACSSDRLKTDLLAAFPIVAKMDIYVLDPTVKTHEVEKIEEVIKTACPNYSYEEMDYDHQLTEYESEEENPPVFKLALEYTLGKDGFTVRLPANGIRFNESKFQLTNVSVLPYMGAGNNAYNGYTFYPDGSGALFAFEDLKNENTTSVASKIYGVDYAYHKITGTYQQTVRYPVFGIMEATRYYDCITFDEKLGESVTRRISGVIYDKVMEDSEKGLTSDISKKFASLVNGAEIEEVEVKRGYVAIIEEGDALTELVNYHGGVLAPYDTVQMNFIPRPKDSYNIADSISVGTNSEWTVVSERKYVGNYKIHYRMLTDDKLAAEKEIDKKDYYQPTWLGMAMAFRDYLAEQGILERLTAEQTKGAVPLYIETFGAFKMTDRILSFPIMRKRPLTSADNIKTMYEDLSKQGVTNINFKLTGYANGGVDATMPYRLKWEKSVSKEMSMQELFDYAASVEGGSLGIYPDFDFSYASSMDNKLFDGFSVRKHAVRTIDDRYARKRYYRASQQRYAYYYLLAVSPAYFSHFYTKLMDKYLKYDNVTGISVGTLGNTLNSDFDEDEPFNREDSKEFVLKALKHIRGGEEKRLNVMVDGGNAYTWKYVDHLIGVPLDSSRYIKASYSVPFLGVVLHGYKNFAGSALNMEGDIDYAKLKAIENGASIYFILSYQNTQKLKEDMIYSQYYSIRYDIWQDDVVEIYNELNREMQDVQDKIIVDHQFLSGLRVPDIGELDRDINQEFGDILDYQSNKAEYEEKRKAEAVADARDRIAGVEVAAQNFITECLNYYSGINGAAYLYVTGERNFERRLASYLEVKASYDQVKKDYEAADDAGKEALSATLTTSEAMAKQALGQLRTYIRNISRAVSSIEKEYQTLTKLLEDAESGKLIIQGTEGCPQSILDEIEAQLSHTRELMAEQLGVTFDMTVDKAEIDTFLHTHIALLFIKANGKTPDGLSVGSVGKAENLYQMIANDQYGLSEEELDLLRYLPANRDMTDDDLIQKYSLTADNTSVKGLVLYIQELLGTNYQFDPVLAGTIGAVESNIRDYFLGILHGLITGMGESSLVPALNFVPNHLNAKGQSVPNTVNIEAVKGFVRTEINKVLMGKNGLIAQVTDGNYDINTVIDKDTMDSLVAAVIKTIESNIKSDTNPSPKKPVEYATPETMERDVRNFINGYYYQNVLATVCDMPKITLKVQNVLYQTDSSLDLLIDLCLETYASPYDESFKYVELYNRVKNHSMVPAQILRITNMLKPIYGDVSDELVAALTRIASARIVGDDKTPKYSGVYSLDTAVNELIEENLSTLTEDTVADLVNKVVALVNASEKKPSDENFDIKKNAENVVYYALMKKLAESRTNSYYYDEEMATMDAAVRSKVGTKITEIKAQLTPESTVYDLYDLVFTSMVDPEDPLSAFISSTASKITHHVDGKGSVADDVQAFYCYLLLSGFDGYELGEDAPEIGIQGSSGVVKNAMKQVKKSLEDIIPALLSRAKSNVSRGEIPTYALSSLLTAEEQDEIANDLFEVLVSFMFAEEDERETLVPGLKAYFQYSYYTAVLKKLNADEMPQFHIAEIYGDDLHTMSAHLDDLLRYYVTTMCGITEEEIDTMIGGHKKDEETEEEEEEASRYLSDDGRIVAVTYGDTAADGSYTQYKTFILNYNNFSVDVVYNDVTYTIPAYGYVVVMH